MIRTLRAPSLVSRLPFGAALLGVLALAPAAAVADRPGGSQTAPLEAPTAGPKAVGQQPERIESLGEDGKFHWLTLPAVIEVESLLPKIKASAGAAMRQDMASFGPGWGGGAQVLWRPPPPVDKPIRNWPNLRLYLPVPQPSRYRITLVHTVAPDYGFVRVFLKGEAVKDFNG